MTAPPASGAYGSAGQRQVHVSVPRTRNARPSGIIVHRRHPEALADALTHNGIPVTSPLRTLVDLAARAERPQAEALVNQADKLDLIHPECLRRELEPLKGEPGAPLLREVLDRSTFTLTDSELERQFLPIVRRVGLAKPATRQWVNGHRVDLLLARARAGGRDGWPALPPDRDPAGP